MRVLSEAAFAGNLVSPGRSTDAPVVSRHLRHDELRTGTHLRCSPCSCCAMNLTSTQCDACNGHTLTLYQQLELGEMT